MPTSNFQPIKLLGPGCLYKFTHLMANSADLDQLASLLDLHCLQGQDIFGFSRKRVKSVECKEGKTHIKFLNGEKTKRIIIQKCNLYASSIFTKI